jgi:hypothetical protein
MTFVKRVVTDVAKNDFLNVSHIPRGSCLSLSDSVESRSGGRAGKGGLHIGFSIIRRLGMSSTVRFISNLCRYSTCDSFLNRLDVLYCTVLYFCNVLIVSSRFHFEFTPVHSTIMPTFPHAPCHRMVF